MGIAPPVVRARGVDLSPRERESRKTLYGFSIFAMAARGEGGRNSRDKGRGCTYMYTLCVMCKCGVVEEGESESFDGILRLRERVQCGCF